MTHPWYVERIPWRHRSRPRRPNQRPVSRADLKAAGVTRARLSSDYVRVEHGMYVHVDDLLPEKTGSGHRRNRRVRTATLALAHLLRNPRRVVTGLGAASVFGMTYLVEDEPLEFLAPKGSARNSASEHVIVHPTRNLEVHRASSRHLPGDLAHLCIAHPATATSHMIRTLSVPDAGRDQRWPVPDLTSVRSFLTPEFIRCVQGGDAFHQTLGERALVDSRLLDVPSGADAALCARVIGHGDVGAESPPETLLRLAVADLAPGLQSQIPVFRDNGTLLTSADLGWEAQGLYLFYDGVHHLQRDQRDHDSTVTTALQRTGGRSLRVIAEDLRDADTVVALRERIIDELR